MEYITYFVYAFAAWNTAVFALYGIDKSKAKKRRWRISEKTLILSAFLMGGAGALTGMIFFRHKTRNLKFKVLIPMAVIINITVIVLYCVTLKK